MEVAAPEYKSLHWIIYKRKSLWPGHFCFVSGVHTDKDSSVRLWMLKCVSRTTRCCIPHSFCIWTIKSSQWNHFSSRVMVNCVMPSCLWCPYYSFAAQVDPPATNVTTPGYMHAHCKKGFILTSVFLTRTATVDMALWDGTRIVPFDSQLWAIQCTWSSYRNNWMLLGLGVYLDLR